MKNVVILLLISINLNLLVAQPKQPPKPNQQQLLLQAQQAKPKGPVPYLLKKDFEEKMVEVTNKLNSVSNGMASVKRSTNAKDEQIANLNAKIKSVEEVLNSANFKIATTSDSLSKTQFTIDELQKEFETKITAMQSENESRANMLWMVIFGLIAIAVVLPIVVFSQMNKKVSNIHNDIGFQIREVKEQLNDNYERSVTDLKNESKNSQSYVDRYISALKQEFNSKYGDMLINANAEIENLKNELAAQKTLVEKYCAKSKQPNSNSVD